jgi:hypothetical protein
MGNGGRNYRCLARINQGPSVCKGAATERQRVDDAMEEKWVNHVLSLTPESETLHEIARRWLSYQDPAKEERKRAVSAALDTAASRELRLQKEFFLGNAMDESRFELLRGELTAQIARLKAELEELSRTADLTPLMDPESLSLLWGGEEIAGKRALMQAALKSVKLIPAKYVGDKTPIRKRLLPEWRDTEVRSWDIAMEGIERSRQRRAQQK